MVNRALNPQGAAVFQVITIPESRFAAYQRDVDFIRKWVGSQLFSLSSPPVPFPGQVCAQQR